MPSNSRATRQARKNVAGNMPRFSLFVMLASVSSLSLMRQCLQTSRGMLQRLNVPRFSVCRQLDFVSTVRPETDVVCLVSTDDEAFTYNKRVNRIAMIQEHKMILKAVERGVSEERIARALNVDIAHIKRKRRLLEGICAEAAEILKDKHIGMNTFTDLKKMVPMRQIEAAELMVAMNKYTVSYAKSLLAATPQTQLVESDKPKRVKGLTDEQVALMERESVNLEREFRIAEQSYGTDHLDLVLTNGYLGALLGNARIVRYLAQHQREILVEFQKLAEVESAAA
jgi:RepB plasmid partitioning protein